MKGSMKIAFASFIFSLVCVNSSISANECLDAMEKFVDGQKRITHCKDKRGPHGNRGYQGPQGLPGIPGVLGVPGTPGTTLGTSFISAVADKAGGLSIQIVDAGSPIEFDTATQVNDGSGNVTLSGDGKTFTLNSAGLYEVTFGAMYAPTIVNTTSAIRLVTTPTSPPGPSVNVVASSCQNGLNSNEWAPASVIISISGTTTLQIVNASAHNIQLLDSTLTGSSSAFITIVKVADP